MKKFANAVAVAAVLVVSSGCSTVADLHARMDQRHETSDFLEAHQFDDRTWPMTHDELGNSNQNG